MVFFSTLIGEDCGSEITSAVFTENAEVWLSTTVGADSEMTPRQQIANVGYALNAETLQGFPPDTTVSSIPYINRDGNVLIGASTPGIRNTYASATFVMSSANAITLQSAGSGDITLTATESGTIKFLTAGTQAGVITGAQLWGIGTTGPDAKVDSLYTGGEQLRLTYADGSTYTGFTTNSGGDLTIDPSGDDLTLGGDAILSDTFTLQVGGKTATAYNAFANNADSPEEAAIAADNDLYIGGDLEVDGSIYAGSLIASGVPWSGITAPTDNLTVSMAAYNSTFTWDPTANSAETAFVMNFDGEDSAADEDQVLLSLNQSSNGTDVTEAADALLTFTNSDANDPVENAIRFDAGAAGTDFTYGINFDAASIGTAELVLQNGETIANTVDGTIALTGDASISGTTGLTFTSTGGLVLAGGTISDGTDGVDIADNLEVSGDTTLAGDLAVNGDDITSNDTLTIDAATDINLDADGADIVLKDGGTTFASFTNSTTDLTLDIVGSQLILGDTDVLNIGGVTGLAYNAISDSGTTSHSLASDDDLYVEGDVEVDGTLYVDGTLVSSGITCTDCLDFTSFEDTLDLDATTDINLGANNLTVDLDSTGIFDIRDGTTTFVSFDDDSTIDITFPAAGTLGIDAAATDNTTTTGVLNLDIDTATSGNIGSSIDYQVVDAAGNVTAYGEKN
ncbi:MAG: hypothetical protein UZ21_OP11001000928 [Microgenomates bacterium OLB22]|nr:MAG: hypothetical protein UZ21_OP11001000928 [Microgenomates bacterium OLB22]